MRSLVSYRRNPWSVFDELESFQGDMLRALTGVGTGRGLARPAQRRNFAQVLPPLSVWSSEDEVVVDAELPGIDPATVEVSVVGDELTLQGKVAATEPADGETCLRRERMSGDFQRTLQLPFRPEGAETRATYKNGILRVTVPRSEQEKRRRIAVES